MDRVLVLGAGVWGIAIGSLLHENGHDVTIWEYLEERANELDKTREHFGLPGFAIPNEIKFTNDLDTNVDFIVVALPAQTVRSVFEKIKINDKTTIVVLSKGIEESSLKRLSQVLNEDFNVRLDQIVTLYGPTHAMGICERVPSMILASSVNADRASAVQKLVANSILKVKIGDDLIGSEIGASLKNCMAIAMGIADGLKLGINTKAAILAHAMEEIAIFGEHFGANKSTFLGLSGIGDLFVSSLAGRNFSVGKKLGEGNSIETILNNMKMVSEGVNSVKAVKLISDRENLTMKLNSILYNILYNSAKADSILSIFQL